MQEDIQDIHFQAKSTIWAPEFIRITDASRSLESWHGIIEDLRQVREAASCLKRLLENGDYEPVIATALTYQIVVQYGKCWDNNAKGRIGVFAEHHKESLKAPLDELHCGLRKRRHKTFAHPGELALHRCFLVLQPDDSIQPSVHIEAAGPIVDVEQLDLIMELVDTLWGMAMTDLNNSIVKLTEELLRHDQKLRAEFIEGRYCTPEQTAVHLMFSHT